MTTNGYVDASAYSDFLGAGFTFSGHSFRVKGFRLSCDLSGTTGLHDIGISLAYGATITHGSGASGVFFETYDSNIDASLDGLQVGYLDKSTGAVGWTGGSGPTWNALFWNPATDGQIDITFPGDGFSCPAGTVFVWRGYGETAYNSNTVVSPAYYCHLLFEVEVD